MVVVNSLPAPGRTVQDWALWRLGRPGISVLLISELAAVLLAAASFRHTSSSHPVLVRTALLLAMAIAYGEVCDRLERLRRYLGADGVVSNHNSVLCFAGLLALPLHLAAALTIAVYLHTFIRSRRHHSARPHRLIFTAAAAIIATFVAGDLYRALGGAHHCQPQAFTAGPGHLRRLHQQQPRSACGRHVCRSAA